MSTPISTSSIGPDQSSFVPFWNNLEDFADLPAIIEPSSDRTWIYKQLSSDVDIGAEQLSDGTKQVVLLCAANTANCVLAYLSALRAGHTIILSGRQNADTLNTTLVEAYRPDRILWDKGEPTRLYDGYAPAHPVCGLSQLTILRRNEIMPNPNLSLVLLTSGSTGSPKAVRLSYANIAANAAQIRLALGLSQRDRAMTVLSMSHIFGLSVIHSHLASGGSLVIDDRSTLAPDFWRTVSRHNVTTLAGVAFTYDIFRQLHIEAMNLPTLRALIQSGDRLSSASQAWLQTTITQNIDVYLMYGMTEGAGRLCVLPPNMLSQKPTSVGLPVPFGSVTCAAESEIVFTGPNVMLGYAQCRDDLARSDDCHGELHTGDIGYIDADGYVYLTGRTSRIIKFLGRRYSLDDIEDRFKDFGEVVAVFDRDGITLATTSTDIAPLRARARLLCKELGLPCQAIHYLNVGSIPRTSNGKIAYNQMSSNSPARGDGQFFFG